VNGCARRVLFFFVRPIKGSQMTSFQTEGGGWQLGAVGVCARALPAVAVLLAGCAAGSKLDTMTESLTRSVRGFVSTNVDFFHPAGVEAATRFQSVVIVQANAQSDDPADLLETDLRQLRVNDKPYYSKVARASGDPLAAGKKEGVDAALEVNVASFKVAPDVRSVETRTVCPGNKITCGNKEAVQQRVACVTRKANLQLRVRLLDVKTRNVAYNRTNGAELVGKKCDGDVLELDSAEVLGGKLLAEALPPLRRDIAPWVERRPLDLMNADAAIASSASRTAFDDAVKFANEARLDQACKRFEDLADTESDSVALTFNLGICEHSRGNIRKANQYYNKADSMSKAPDRLIGKYVKETNDVIKAGAAASVTAR
jgi:hypothetical protein